MNWWQRLWEQLWGSESREPVVASEPAMVLPTTRFAGTRSAVPEEWFLASVIRG